MRGGGGEGPRFVSACACRPPPGPGEPEDRIIRVYTINPAKTILSPPTTAATKPGVRPRSRGSLSTCGKRIDAAEEAVCSNISIRGVVGGGGKTDSFSSLAALPAVTMRKMRRERQELRKTSRTPGIQLTKGPR